LTIAKEYLHWQRVLAEIQSRRLVFEEQERIADEMEKLEQKITTLRTTRQYELIDRLLARQARCLHYWDRLPAFTKGPDVHSPAGHDAGNGESNPGKG
jgi:hypothetical protein